MKNTLIILAAIIGLNSCETRLNPLKERNSTPTFTLSNGSNNWGENDFYAAYSDSVKLHFPYLIDYNLVDEQTKLLTMTSGTIYPIFYNDSIVDQTQGISNGTGQFRYASSSLGTENIEITVTDGWDELNTAKINLTVFDNLPPVSNIEIEDVSVVSPYERTIDLSGSYDRDAKYGGVLLHFEYIIDTDTVLFHSNKMNFIFPGPGTYAIGGRVMDNDSVWSSVSSVSYNVL